MVPVPVHLVALLALRGLRDFDGFVKGFVTMVCVRWFCCESDWYLSIHT